MHPHVHFDENDEISEHQGTKHQAGQSKCTKPNDYAKNGDNGVYIGYFFLNQKTGNIINTGDNNGPV
jgi:hypothetical protein